MGVIYHWGQLVNYMKDYPFLVAPEVLLVARQSSKLKDSVQIRVGALC